MGMPVAPTYAQTSFRGRLESMLPSTAAMPLWTQTGRKTTTVTGGILIGGEAEVTDDFFNRRRDIHNRFIVGETVYVRHEAPGNCSLENFTPTIVTGIIFTPVSEVYRTKIGIFPDYLLYSPSEFNHYRSGDVTILRDCLLKKLARVIATPDPAGEDVTLQQLSAPTNFDELRAEFVSKINRLSANKKADLLKKTKGGQ